MCHACALVWRFPVIIKQKARFLLFREKIVVPLQQLTERVEVSCAAFGSGIKRESGEIPEQYPLL